MRRKKMAAKAKVAKGTTKPIRRKRKVKPSKTVGRAD
jgi:hypothetical protein